MTKFTNKIKKIKWVVQPQLILLLVNLSQNNLEKIVNICKSNVHSLLYSVS